MTMGADGAFQPGSYEVSGLWVLTSILLGFIAAVAGGRVCIAIARRSGAVTALAIVVVVLGIAMAVPAAMPATEVPPPARASDVGNIEAMQNARQPTWVAFLNPIIGAAGVLVGGRCKG